MMQPNEQVAVTGVRERNASTEDYSSFVALWPKLGIHHTPPERLYWERELAPHTFLLETTAGEIISLALCKSP